MVGRGNSHIDVRPERVEEMTPETGSGLRNHKKYLETKTLLYFGRSESVV